MSIPPEKPKTHSATRIIHSVALDIERKRFVIEQAENHGGKFLRIVEVAHSGRFNAVVVPASGLRAFWKALGEVAPPE